MSDDSNSYASLRYVDYVGSDLIGNYLFRGPSPVVNGQSFDEDGLTAAIQEAPLPPGTPPVPGVFNLMVVSLLNTSGGDAQSLMVEITHFETQPPIIPPGGPSGNLVLWETLGTDQCYYQTAQPSRDQMVATLDDWLPDPLIWRVAALGRYLRAALPPTVVYVHCDGGCDRTGEMIGAYMLGQMKMDWREMYDANKPCQLSNGTHRPCGCNNYRALEWFAYWLNTQPGYNISNIGNDHGCYDPPPIGVHKPCSP
jgi:hypothetical protein